MFKAEKEHVQSSQMRGSLVSVRSCMKRGMAGAQRMGQPFPHPMPWMKQTGASSTTPGALPTQALKYLSSHRVSNQPVVFPLVPGIPREEMQGIRQ